MSNKTWMGVCSLVCSFAAAAQGVTIESVAKTIAEKHNQTSAALLDESTVATSATAVGKNVRFRYVLRAKKGLSQQKLAEFRAALMADIAPRACKANAGNPAFERGLYYTFIYESTYGEPLAQFDVDRQSCKN